MKKKKKLKSVKKKTKRVDWETKEDIYKAYKHGGSIAYILKEFGITFKKFQIIMKEIGGAGFKFCTDRNTSVLD
jgi:hypothetical protein